jgi:hypothetical protein
MNFRCSRCNRACLLHDLARLYSGDDLGAYRPWCRPCEAARVRAWYWQRGLRPGALAALRARRALSRG